jgi:hypothetical protein
MIGRRRVRIRRVYVRLVLVYSRDVRNRRLPYPTSGWRSEHYYKRCIRTSSRKEGAQHGLVTLLCLGDGVPD